MYACVDTTVRPREARSGAGGGDGSPCLLARGDTEKENKKTRGSPKEGGCSLLPGPLVSLEGPTTIGYRRVSPAVNTNCPGKQSFSDTGVFQKRFNTAR